MPEHSEVYLTYCNPAKDGSSSYLGKHADTMVMDFLATITTHKEHMTV
jgi:hypothetical protein